MTVTTIDHAPAAQPKPHGAQAGVQGGLLDPKMLLDVDARRAAQARPAHAVAQPGDVHRRDRRRVEHRPRRRRPVVVRLADRGLAVADGGLRQPRRSGRRGPRQGAGRHRCARPRPTPWPADSSAGPRRSPAREEEVAAPLLQQGDVVVVEAGQTIPGDGDVVEGIASVDESAITGESAPVIRESGGDRSAVTGGTTVLSDRIVVKITQKPGESFIDRMIALVEGANRQKTPNEIALNILLAALTIIFVFAVATLQPLAIYSKANNPGVPDTSGAQRQRHHRHRDGRPAGLPHPDHHRRTAVGHRHRRHGPPGAAQRAGHVGPRGRGRRRRQHAAARQDRHHHARQPAGVGRSCRSTGVTPERARRRRPAVQPGRRDARGPLHRGVRQAGVRPTRPHPRRTGRRALGRVHRDDPDVRRRPRRRPPAAQGCDRVGRRLGPRRRRHRPRRTRRHRRRHLRRRRHPAGRRRGPRRHGAARSASSTSRTSSSRACGSGSTRCAGWASAR